MLHDRYIFPPNGKPLKSTNQHRRACLRHPGHLSGFLLSSIPDLVREKISTTCARDTLTSPPNGMRFFILPRLPSKTGGAPIIAELLQHDLTPRRSRIRNLGTLSSISGSRCSAQLLQITLSYQSFHVSLLDIELAVLCQSNGSDALR